uniref:Uncharacterized protein n=1 Tax=Anopheles gambiae TaxID=7165 RepID=A0A0E3W284_ANOGA
MLGPWLQPPIHVDTRSPTGVASPDPAIEFAVLPCALYRTKDRCRTPSWWGISSASSCMPQPSYPASLRHRQDARFAVQFSNLVVHPCPPRSMLEHTAKDGPEDMSLKYAQSVCILCSDSSGLVSVEDHRAIQSVIYLTFRAGLKSSGTQQ